MPPLALRQWGWLLLAVCWAGIGSAADKPNIVLIMSDDQGWGDLSLHGNTDIRTPHIDSLGKDGAQFKHFYVQPVCAPTRAELLTGRYSRSTGVTGVSRGAERINLDETLLPELLKNAGYATGGFGKWHNGQQFPYHPNARGFDEWFGFCIGHYSNYFDTLIEHNNTMGPSEGYIIDVLTDKAIAFIETNKDGPFFCYLPYNTPHSPMQVPDEYYDRVNARGLTLNADNKKLGSRKKEPDFTIAALAMCENIDMNVGRVLETLDELKLSDNTIVLYLSDNGPNSARWNGGLRGRKGSTFEGGVRSPLLIRWPGKINTQKIDTIAGAIDLMPTLCDFAGVEANTAQPIHGVSLKPLLLEGKAPAGRVLLAGFTRNHTLRSQTYRYGNRGLYDISQDPGESNNLVNELPEIAKSMKAQLDKLVAETMASPTAKPFTVGHPACESTPLPIRDAELQGKNLGRSSRHPNDSHLVNWSSTDSFPFWKIDVLTAGTYEVLVDYTCSKENIGCVLEAAFGNAKTSTAITEVYDPPLLPSPDRTPRGESMDKLFKAASLGLISLKKTSGTLTLQCLKQTGPGIVDIKNLHLVRKSD